MDEVQSTKMQKKKNRGRDLCLPSVSAWRIMGQPLPLPLDLFCDVLLVLENCVMNVSLTECNSGTTKLLPILC